MARILLVKTIISIFVCANIVGYIMLQTIYAAQRDRVLGVCMGTSFRTVSFLFTRENISKKRFNVLTSLPASIYNIKGKIVQIPSMARNSMQMEKEKLQVVTLQEINGFLKNKAVNNNVMITVCDSGYLDIYRIFYKLNKMWQYPNFVTFVLDKKGYDVVYY